MKLFELYLKEEDIEVKVPADLWTENKDSASTYVSNTPYFVKPMKDGLKFEVSTVDGTERKQFALLTRQQLDAGFTPIRPQQTPDAEGYTQYRTNTEVEAFKYDGDPVKLGDDPAAPLLNKGDYLARTPVGSKFEYEPHKGKDFEAHFEEK